MRRYFIQFKSDFRRTAIPVSGLKRLGIRLAAVSKNCLKLSSVPPFVPAYEYSQANYAFSMKNWLSKKTNQSILLAFQNPQKCFATRSQVWSGHSAGITL